MNIIPGILEVNYSEIESKVDSVLGDAEKIHIDICDGLLTKQKTWPYSQSPNNRIEENYHVAGLLNEDIGLPHWEDVNYEFDLMIQNPDINSDIWGRLGANIIVIHLSSFKDNEKIKSFILNMNDYFIDIVLAFTFDEYQNNSDFIDELVQTKMVKSLQVMTIKNIGFQGQEFDKRCVDLLISLRQKYEDLNLRVDGGIKDNTIDFIIDYVDEIVIGSGIFKEGNARENLNYFQDLC